MSIWRSEIANLAGPVVIAVVGIALVIVTQRRLKRRFPDGLNPDGLYRSERDWLSDREPEELLDSLTGTLRFDRGLLREHAELGRRVFYAKAGRSGFWGWLFPAPLSLTLTASSNGSRTALHASAESQRGPVLEGGPRRRRRSARNYEMAFADLFDYVGHLVDAAPTAPEGVA